MSAAMPACVQSDTAPGMAPGTALTEGGQGRKTAEEPFERMLCVWGGSNLNCKC